MKRLMLFIILVFALSLPASAHAGRTDSRGGHTDRSTGEYHYHHGYEAHLHINGECPYNFIDKTDHSSGSSSGTPSASSPFASSATPISNAPAKEKLDEDVVFHLAFGGYTILGIVVMLVLFLRFNLQEHQNIGCVLVFLFFPSMPICWLILHWIENRNRRRAAQKYKPIITAQLLDKLDPERGEESFTSSPLPAPAVTSLSPAERDALEQEYREYLNKKAYYEYLFDRSPEDLAGVPESFGALELGSDGLPRQVGFDHWGPAFTVYLTSRGEVFHRSPRCTKTGQPVHIFTVKRIKPCPKCRAKRIDDSWFVPYRNIIYLMRYYDITPKPRTLQSPGRK